MVRATHCVVKRLTGYCCSCCSTKYACCPPYRMYGATCGYSIINSTHWPVRTRDGRVFLMPRLGRLLSASGHCWNNPRSSFAVPLPTFYRSFYSCAPLPYCVLSCWLCACHSLLLGSRSLNECSLFSSLPFSFTSRNVVAVIARHTCRRRFISTNDV